MNGTKQLTVTPQEVSGTPATWWRRKDWFGYLVGGLIGLIITVAATWYQMSASQKEATAAEFERARAIRQGVIAIVEEQALNGSRLEPDRITRLIEQRRRDQSVTLSIPLRDVVEQAEFNILGSTYLPIERKEQIKPIFSSFFAELASLTYVAVPDSAPNAQQWNSLAKQIQEGKSADALVTLRRLQEDQMESVNALTKLKQPSVFDSLREFFRNPVYVLAFLSVYMMALMLLLMLRRRRRDGIGEAFRSRRFL